MSDYIEDWDDERFVESAIRVLVERHRAEYEELRGQVVAARIEELERQVTTHVRRINELRAQNPDGISVPSLTETTNMLVQENDGLRAIIAKHEKAIEKFQRENRKLREIIGKE